MSEVEGGFHPWQRAAARLGRIRPHRQLYLLCVVSVLVAGTIAVAILTVLQPTHRSLDDASRTLVPAFEALDVADKSYQSTDGPLQQVLSPDVATRAAAISDLTSLNTAGDAAWARYRRIAVGLPGERELQRSFARHRQAALDAGGVFVTEAEPSSAGMAAVTAASSLMQRDLNRIRDLYEQRIERALHDASSEVGSASDRVLFVAIPCLLVLLVAFGVAIRSARTRERHTAKLDRVLHEEAERNELEARMQRAFDMAQSEDSAYAVAGRALGVTAPGRPAELLIADSSHAHFRQVTASDAHGGPGCPVMTPTACPAAVWGQTQVWPTSAALDACPYLQDRQTGPCSAVCVPVSIGGNAVGVVHATAPDADPPSGPTIGAIEIVARKVGERVGMLRAFERSETQAHTDPLTGLMNRRSLETTVRELTDGGRSYVAAYGDLDHFKQLNDVHGHDAGDRALRLFARVLRDGVRPNDVTARYGGEEFVVVLPDCTIDDAFLVIDRIRERLALALVDGTVPRFTVSFGVARSSGNLTFSETLEAADAALLNAKATGRNRVVVSGESDVRASAAAELTEADEPAASSPGPLGS